MIYSNLDIRDALASGKLVIDPQPTRDMFSTSAVDLLLDDKFTIYAPVEGTETSVMVGTADPEEATQRYGRTVTLRTGEYLELRPHHFALAFTQERVALPLDLAARVEGKSSLARWGVSIHQSAPTIHAGFAGQIRLEIANVGNFVCRLTPGIKICQLIIEELRTTAEVERLSQFQNQRA